MPMDATDENLYFSDMDWNPQSAVHMNRGGIAYCQPDWSWDTRLTPFQDYDLWCVFGGRGSLRTPERTFALSAGDCFVLRPNRRYVGRHDPENPLHVIFVHFDFLAGAVPPPVYQRLHHLNFARELLSRAVTCFQDGDQRAADAWLQAALQDIYRQRDRRPADGMAVRLDALCDRIRTHPELPYRLADLARPFGLSTDHFSRLFKQHRGMTPRAFVLQARIDVACTLLSGSDHSVARIADILGYSDVYFFSKQFKAKTGLTPTQYRKRRA